MHRKWKLAIYDFNGTLINDGVLAHKCVIHIFKTLRPDIAPPTYEEYRNEITANFTEFYYNHGIPRTISGDEMNAIRTPYYEKYQTEVRLITKVPKNFFCGVALPAYRMPW